MRTNLVLLMLIALALPASAAWAQVTGAAASSQATVAELQRELSAMKANLAELQTQIEQLQQQLEEVASGRAEAESPVSPTDDLTALRAAAQEEAAADELVAKEAEEVTFTSGALGLQALNPEISVTGDFNTSYRSGDQSTPHYESGFRALEISFDSYLDPYSKMKGIVEFSPEETELGEAYFTRYGIRDDLNLTLGKFRQQFGVVNRWHKHGLDQFDFPLPLRQIFGPGGLNQTGASLDWQMPSLGPATQGLTLQITNGQNGRVFGENTRNMPAVLAHYKNYRDLSKDTYLEFGLTGLRGRNDTWPVLGPGDEIMAQRRDLWTTVLGADLTIVWEPTERMRYENWVWRTEAYLLNKGILAPDGSGKDTLRSWGAYSYLQKKLSRTVDAGIRVDYYEPDVKAYADLPDLSLAPLAVAESGAHQWFFAPYLTWYQSPWVHWRLEYDHLASHKMGPDEDTIILQCTFSAGPHKHERY